MLNRNKEQVSLLEHDDLAKANQNQDCLATMPKDVVHYLLDFCDIESVKSLAQANKKLHLLINNKDFRKTFEVAANFTVSVPNANGGISIQPAVGYITGQYNQLKNFFVDRNAQYAQRLTELNASCCINSNPDKLAEWAKPVTAFFGTGSVIFSGASIGLYVKTISLSIVPTAIFSGIVGACCLASTSGCVCLCVSNHVAKKQAERNDIQSSFVGAPKASSLHGTLFSWKPKEKHADHVPQKLRMS